MKQVLVARALSGVYFKASSHIEVLDEYEGESGQFLKTFAINDKRNKNGWRATWEGIRKNIETFKGKPGIEFVKCDEDGCDLDHTEAQTEEMSLQVQEPFRVTTIVGFTFDESTHTAYFIDKVNDPDFYQKVKSLEIKYVSPSIWPKAGGYEIVGQMENGMPMIDVWEWSGLHKAYVNKPAFGDDAKITATCEGHDCPVKLLTAKEKQKQLDIWDQGVSAIVLYGDAVQDCVTRKIKDYGQKPDDQKLAIFFSECRKSLGGIVDQGDLPHLQEIPLLINHNKKKRFMGVNSRVLTAVEKLLKDGSGADESKVFDLIRQDKVNSSFSSCTCSASHMPTDEEHEELKSKFEAAEHEKEDMKSKLEAAEHEKEKEMNSRKARLVAILKAQTEEEREKTATAIRAQDDEKEKEALEHAEKEVKTATGTEHKKDENAMVHEKEQDAKVAKLEATIAKPLVKKMAKARALKGASDDEIKTFTDSYENKSLAAIEEDYNKEKILIEEALAGAEEPEEQKHFAFQASEQSAFSGKSLEETFEEIF